MTLASRLISKAVFLSALNCSRQAWLGMREPISRVDSDAEHLMNQGQLVGVLARRLFPEGELIGGAGEAAYRETLRVLGSKREGLVVFEALLQCGTCVARPDILVRRGDGWHLIEVKSGTSVKDEYVVDAAFTTMVSQDAGLRIDSVSLVFLNSKYRLGSPDQALFVKSDITERVNGFTKVLRDAKAMVSAQLLGSSAPEAKIVSRCKGCPFFSVHCDGVGVEYPFFLIPGLQKKRFDEFVAVGAFEVADVPDALLRTEKQRVFKKAVVSRSPVVDKAKLRKLLDSVKWPASYLDFETITEAVPTIPGASPYEQIPTQFSLHTFSSPGVELRHNEYLAEPNVDCREDLLRSLLDAVDAHGSVVVYSSFESGVLKRLAERFPRFKREIQEIANRLFDLRGLFSGPIIHPDARGSESIKYLLPALTDLSYDHLAIKNGYQAVAAFAALRDDSMAPARRQELREQLLEYCRNDTLAMARLHSAAIEFLSR